MYRMCPGRHLQGTLNRRHDRWQPCHCFLQVHQPACLRPLLSNAVNASFKLLTQHHQMTAHSLYILAAAVRQRPCPVSYNHIDFGFWLAGPVASRHQHKRVPNQLSAIHGHRLFLQGCRMHGVGLGNAATAVVARVQCVFILCHLGAQ